MAVGDAGSFEGAARSLDTQTHVVRRGITALEAELNSQLVAPAAHGVALTTSGEKAISVARAFQAQLVQLAAELGGGVDDERT